MASSSTQAIAASDCSQTLSINQSSGSSRPTSPVHSSEASELRSLCSSTRAIAGSEHSLFSQSLSITQFSAPSPQPYLIPKQSHPPRSISSQSRLHQFSQSCSYSVPKSEERSFDKAVNLSTISERTEPGSTKKTPIVKKESEVEDTVSTNML